MGRSAGENPRHGHLAACYAHMGRVDEARAIVAKLRAITPLVVPSVAQYRNPEDRELLFGTAPRNGGDRMTATAGSAGS
jgi:hypothetical protein